MIESENKVSMISAARQFPCLIVCHKPNIKPLAKLERLPGRLQLMKNPLPIAERKKIVIPKIDVRAVLIQELRNRRMRMNTVIFLVHAKAALTKTASSSKANGVVHIIS